MDVKERKFCHLLEHPLPLLDHTLLHHHPHPFHLEGGVVKDVEPGQRVEENQLQKGEEEAEDRTL